VKSKWWIPKGRNNDNDKSWQKKKINDQRENKVHINNKCTQTKIWNGGILLYSIIFFYADWPILMKQLKKEVTTK